MCLTCSVQQLDQPQEGWLQQTCAQKWAQVMCNPGLHDLAIRYSGIDKPLVQLSASGGKERI